MKTDVIRTQDDWTRFAAATDTGIAIAAQPTVVFSLDDSLRIQAGLELVSLDPWSYAVLSAVSRIDINADTGLAVVVQLAVDDALPEGMATRGELDELSAAVLADVFALTQRTNPHQAAAMAFILQQLAAQEQVAADNDRMTQTATTLDDARARLATTKNDLVNRVKTYFIEHMDEAITLELLCDVCDCAKSTLAAAFRSDELPSPMRVLAQMRILQAQELLTNTRESINEIGAKVGYPDAAAFTHFFSKHTGKSPREFRDQSLWLL